MAQENGKIVTIEVDMARALHPPGATLFPVFIDDFSPQLYQPPRHLVTSTFIARNLPKAFEGLPIYGSPEPGQSLQRFYKNKLKLYLGLTDKEFRELNHMCSIEMLRYGKELIMNPDIQDPLLMNVHVDFVSPPDEDDLAIELENNLHIVKKDIEKKGQGQEAQAQTSKDDLKYEAVQLIPLEQQARSLNGNQANAVEEATPPMITSKNKRGRGKKGSKGKSERGGAPVCALKEKPPLTDRLQPGIDILFKIRIYKPFDYEAFKNKDRSLKELFYHDLILTGRNLVADIKKHFVCSNSKSVKERTGSGFLFIKNGFYVDKNDGSDEYAEKLREWCATHALGLFPKYDMHTSRLDQLQYKLGNPDVYIHDSSCEHIIIFSEVRLVTANDPIYFSYYPRITAIAHKQKFAFCYNCGETTPKWIVSGCDRIPYNMALFCQDCLRVVLYDPICGRKICKFKAYPYKGADEKNGS